ncbi:hypothetical protein STCU_09588 [Strigomonas culicis]|nr:hypothetical protein STCU_09588 [Strigomonas culicis]|eukprot:EPY19169.1 hypothetical protein STCU_09588 [Strigomonas culicis]
MQDGQYAEAARQFSKALSLAPATCTARDRAVLLCNLSAARFRSADAAASADDAREAIARDATYARAHYRLAVAEHKLKHFEVAEEALRTCLAMDATHVEAAALLREVAPLVKELRKTAEERTAEKARHAAEVREQQLDQDCAKAFASAFGPAHANTFVYCNYCNESGHTRATCPMLRKRPRPPQ